MQRKNSMNSLPFIGIFLSLVLLAGCAPESAPQREAPLEGPLADTTVMLDIYSGMPNPQWSLTAEESQALVDALSALPEGESGEFPDALGYRGIIASFTLPGGLPGSVRAHHDLVLVMRNDVGTYLRDEERAIERLLLASGEDEPGIGPELSAKILEGGE